MKKNLFKKNPLGKQYLSLLIVLLLIASIALTGCGGGDSAGSGAMQDPYEAYGLERGKSFEEGDYLQYAMSEKPPKAILLQPVFYYRAYYKTVSLSGEYLLEKGKSIEINLDLNLIHETGGEYPLKSHIVLKYDGKKDEDLFHADTDTYGNPTIVKDDGLYYSDYGQHNIKDGAVRFEYISAEGENSKTAFVEAPDELLYTPLRVDIGEAKGGDGNIGFIYFKIAGVKR